jgi:hypothetical protein
MADPNTPDYYRTREQRERAMSESAASPAAAAIHRQLAERYSELVLGAPPVFLESFDDAPWEGVAFVYHR